MFAKPNLYTILWRIVRKTSYEKEEKYEVFLTHKGLAHPKTSEQELRIQGSKLTIPGCT